RADELIDTHAQPVVADVFNRISRWCLVIAIAALGMRTSLAALGTLGWRPVALMATETVVLAALMLILNA
ncbi:MAG: hypothetical protein ACREIP_19400, partial [Alphaproteobacteria bacterium]